MGGERLKGYLQKAATVRVKDVKEAQFTSNTQEADQRKVNHQHVLVEYRGGLSVVNLETNQVEQRGGILKMGTGEQMKVRMSARDMHLELMNRLVYSDPNPASAHLELVLVSRHCQQTFHSHVASQWQQAAGPLVALPLQCQESCNPCSCHCVPEDKQMRTSKGAICKRKYNSIK